MVAVMVDRDIDDVVQELRQAIGRFDRAVTPRQREARRMRIIQLGDEVHAMQIDLERALCRHRDWIDAHRRDDPPHELFAARWDEFWSIDVRQHADAGTAMEQAAEAMCR